MSLRTPSVAAQDGTVVATAAIDVDMPTMVLPGLGETTTLALGEMVVPTLVEGTELVGEFEGSGYREPPQLVSRADRQLVRLPGLLYLLVKLLAGQPTERVSPPPGGYRRVEEVADALSRETGDQYAGEHIVFLVDEKLAPLGITSYCEGTLPEVTKSDPFLAFKFKTTVFSDRVTWVLAGLFTWLYNPLVMVVVLGGFVLSEMWALGTQDTGAALQQALYSPVSVLIVLGLALASAGFHEIGHATACRYSGVRPGAMGMGIYLVWPAFYTDITNSYRLGRGGRIRTDLGGVYFNALFTIALVLAYAQTGYTPLLVAVVSVNLEIIQQLLPSLRFDGYYIISDLCGIPDLFKYIGPILKRVLLRRPPDDRLAELKRWPQTLVSVWVLFVIPALALQLGYIVAQLPELITSSWHRSQHLIAHAGDSGNYLLGGASAVVQILFLLLPVAGVTLILYQLLKAVLRLVIRRSRLADHLAGRRRVGRHRAGAGRALGATATPAPAR